MESTEIRFLSEKICEIMNVSYEDMLHSNKQAPALCRAFCVYLATQELGASARDLHLHFSFTRRTIHSLRAKIRDGIVRESFYSEPYNKIKEGLSL